MNHMSGVSFLISRCASSVQWSQPFFFNSSATEGLNTVLISGIICQLFLKGEGDGAERREEKWLYVKTSRWQIPICNITFNELYKVLETSSQLLAIKLFLVLIIMCNIVINTPSHLLCAIQ